MTEPSTKTLDHIVHLTPPGSIEETTQQWRKLGFTVIPGGTHTDGLTTNALVILADGVYLELISFVHPVSHFPPGSPERQRREAHWWASKSPGWIDFGFLGSGTDTGPQRISDIINKRAQEDGSGARYSGEYRKGRIRPDGRELKWIITDPDLKHGRGTLPFFCGDVTPREWRVPTEPLSNTQHPSGAIGVAYVRAVTKRETLAIVSRQLTSVVGNPPIESTATESTWTLETVRHATPRLILSAPKDDDENAFAAKTGKTGTGIYEVAFIVEQGRKAGSVRTPYGKIVWSPLK